MSTLCRLVSHAAVAAWMIAFCGGAFGQTAAQPSGSSGTATKGQWKPRSVPSPSPPPQSAGASTGARTTSAPRTAQPWTPYHRSPSDRNQLVSVEAETIPTPAPATAPAPNNAGPKNAAPSNTPSINAPLNDPRSVPPGDIPFESLGSEDGLYAGENGCGDVFGDECNPCEDPVVGRRYGRPCGYRFPYIGSVLGWVIHHSEVFAGVQGFRGPMDLGRNGNFGIHEGVNLSGPLGDPWGTGFQVGVEAVQSNFFGNNAVDEQARDQVFVTAGFFHRKLRGGLQGGIAFDYLHDDYYDQADLTQLRSETSLMFGRVHELGYFGAYDLAGDSLLTRLPIGRGVITPMRPTDTYSLFYRRYFSGGGVGRAWGGLSGYGECLLGAEATVPLGTDWALQSNFVYLIPDGDGVLSQQSESWSVAFSLVWYPGRSSNTVYRNPFAPVFNVADNSTFLIRRSGPITVVP